MLSPRRASYQVCFLPGVLPTRCPFVHLGRSEGCWPELCLGPPAQHSDICVNLALGKQGPSQMDIINRKLPLSPSAPLGAMRSHLAAEPWKGQPIDGSSSLAAWFQESGVLYTSAYPWPGHPYWASGKVRGGLEGEEQMEAAWNPRSSTSQPCTASPGPRKWLYLFPEPCWELRLGQP